MFNSTPITNKKKTTFSWKWGPDSYRIPTLLSVNKPTLHQIFKYFLHGFRVKCVQTPVQLEHTILTATRSVIVTMELSVTMSMASAIVFQGSKEPRYENV